jgi:hypothetical protein
MVTALFSTGVIWTRYATQIIPVNYNLMSVNIFVALTGLYQLARKNGYVFSIYHRLSSVFLLIVLSLVSA